MMEIQYFGWSGITLRHADTLIGFDLFGEAVTWDALEGADATILCLTHGHPEHCGSLRDLLLAGGSRLATTHLVSSLPVVQHLARGVSLPAENVHAVQASDRLTIGAAHITAFGWRHLPLLPPGLSARIEYAACLASRPVELMRIGISSLRLPIHAPMFGYHVRFAEGHTVLNYAEGLHRVTDPDEVAQVAQALPAQTLLFAVEPEDVEAIPRWLVTLQPERVLLYEAHRPWRELFRLPYVDLERYAGDLAARFPGIAFQALTRVGQVLPES